MLFQGTYTTAFYRQLRDALHDQGRSHSTNDAVMLDARWDKLAHSERLYRSPRPLVAPNS